MTSHVPRPSTRPHALTAVDRRTFCKLLGGGIVVLITTKPADLFAQRRAYPEDLNAYLHIDEKGHVTVFSGKIEMGQGVLTSQAQMAAEELGVSLAAITMVLGDTDRCPWDAGTWGSLTTRVFGPALRAAAAEARSVLLNLAAKQLGVARADLVVEDGIVSVSADPSRRVSYAELAKGKQIARLVGEKAILRSVREFKVMGKSPKRLDGREKVTGEAQYAGDLRLPGMLYASILRPPVHGAKRKSLDTTRAKAIDGVLVVEQGDLVATLHAHPDRAAEAASVIKATWDLPAAAFDTESVGEAFVRNATDADVKFARGDVSLRPEPAHLVESTFRTPYKAHAPMEPHTAVAEWKDGRMTVWAGTQSPFGTKDRLVRELALDEKNVRVITPYLGGGFGGKSSSNQASEAAQLARLTGKPVMVAWTRSEEFFFDTFDPASVTQIASATDAQGKITYWDQRIWGSGDRATELFYDIPNARIRTSMNRGSAGAKLHPFATGPWRAPGAGPNVFARESQIDILAAAAKVDPLEFRLRNVSEARPRKVLQTAAEAFGWKAAPGPSGTGRAIAIGYDSGTYVAIAAQVSVDRRSGALRVDRVVAAQDMGIVVNPDGAIMQMESCITMGLGYALREELRFSGGDVLDRNFGTYPIPRFSWLPKIETILVKNDDLTPQGGGEPAIVPMGAVIANALFDLTGARVYRLPLTPKRVLAAMKKT